MEILNEQELHQLAMNHIGKELERKGFEFLAINSQLKKHPQFVCVDKPTNTLHFVLVKQVNYPEDPEKFDMIWMESFKNHAIKLKAKVFYAGVGIANAENYENPIYKNQDYVIQFSGIQEII